MTGTDIDELGPVDYLVVEFPPGVSHFNGEMAAELAKLVDAGTIRILDLVILIKDQDGNIDGMEIEDLDPVDDLRNAEAQLSEILAADDVVNLAAAMEPGTTAGVLVWENTWAAPFASAARRSGGQLVANGRIPIQAILARSRRTNKAKETEMPLGRGRVGRRGVIGRPVARTAAVVGGAAVVRTVLAAAATGERTAATIVATAGTTAGTGAEVGPAMTSAEVAGLVDLCSPAGRCYTGRGGPRPRS